MNNTSEVLIDLGVALVAFGTALKEAGTRLQAIQLQPAVALQAAAVATAVPIASRLSREGYVRIWDIIGRRATKGCAAIPAMIPISRATWYAGVKSGLFPKPIKHGRIAMWRLEDLRVVVAELSASLRT
jgi:predicted DNA-binding transcriptional regulator AlpA